MISPQYKTKPGILNDIGLFICGLKLTSHSDFGMFKEIILPLFVLYQDLIEISSLPSGTYHCTFGRRLLDRFGAVLFLQTLLLC